MLDPSCREAHHKRRGPCDRSKTIPDAGTEPRGCDLEIDRIGSQVCRKAKETHEDKTNRSFEREKVEIKKGERGDQASAEFDGMNWELKSKSSFHTEDIGFSGGALI